MNHKAFFWAVTVSVLVLTAGILTIAIADPFASLFEPEPLPTVQTTAQNTVPTSTLDAADILGAGTVGDLEGSTDARPLLDGLFADCDLEPIVATATEMVPYTNAEKGISMELPYNAAWGSSKFRLPPYTTGENRISFGHAFPFEGCGWVRDIYLEFLPHQPFEQRVSELRNDNGLLRSGAVTTSTINGLNVVQYYSEGLCSYVEMIVEGRTYDYQFIPTCGNEDGYVETFKEIINTIKLREL